MAQNKQIALSHSDQVEAFKEAKEQIAADVDALDEDVREWRGEPTDGDTIRILSKAYQGNLSFALDVTSMGESNRPESKSAESEAAESGESSTLFRALIRDILKFVGGDRWAR